MNIPDPEFMNVYSWLDLLGELSRLSQAGQALIIDLQLDIKNNAMPIDIIGDMDRLERYLSVSPYGMERGRLKVECGVACHHLKYARKAEKHMREAVAAYQAFPHECGVANVLLAVLLWQAYDCSLALECFRNAQGLFKRLLYQPDIQENARPNAAWYRARIADLDQWLIKFATKSC